MFARFAQSAAFAIALCAGGQANAVTYGTYYDETTNASCFTSSTNVCRLNFSQIPSDKLLMVSRINCRFQTTGALLHATLYISATLNGSALSGRFLSLNLPAGVASGSGGYYFTSSSENTHFLIGQGRFPYIETVSANVGNSFQSCTIIGDLVTPVQ